MKIHSDVLVTSDLYDTLPHGVILTQCDWAGSRSRDKAWIVRLSGSSRYAQAGNTGYKAATYDEWGWWMVRLFEIDPTAIVGSYKGVEDFHIKTLNRFVEGFREVTV